MGEASCHLTDSGWWLVMKLKGHQTLVSEARLEFGLYPGGIQNPADIFDYIFCSKQYATGNQKWLHSLKQRLDVDRYAFVKDHSGYLAQNRFERRTS